MFKSQFPQLTPESIGRHASERRKYAAEYHDLLDPSRVQSTEIRMQLTCVNAFGTAMYPIVMATYHDFRSGDIAASELIEIMDGSLR